MKLKSLSLYDDFLSLFHKTDLGSQKPVRLGDLRLSLKLLNTPQLSAEGKLIYAYLFGHRQDVTGVTVPKLSAELGIPPAIIRINLTELELKNHITLITATPTPGLSEVVYYYNIVNHTKYGMLNLQNP
ncbi:MAG: hypothetical protein ACYSWP_05535 [Planctomycetota bacterium]|jgi:hypothetical protein